jgi:hypothetical protein
MREVFEAKKIRVRMEDKDVFYTVQRVINMTSQHLIFIDKFGKEKIIRLSDIIEGSEV